MIIFRRSTLSIVGLVSALWFGLAPARAAPCALNLFAAASLTETADALIAAYKDKAGVTVCGVYGGSSALARQIEFGAPAAVFLSAHPKWVTYLVKKGRVAAPDHAVVAYNRLVLAARTDSAWSLDWNDLETAKNTLGDKTIAVGQLDTVPVGIYAEEALTSLGLLEPLRPHLVSGNNVRTLSVWLEQGEVDAAILYGTDVDAFADLRAVAVFPSDSHEPIAYEAALVAVQDPATQDPAARALYDYLSGPEAAPILSSHGFDPAESHISKEQ